MFNYNMVRFEKRAPERKDTSSPCEFFDDGVNWSAFISADTVVMNVYRISTQLITWSPGKCRRH